MKKLYIKLVSAHFEDGTLSVTYTCTSSNLNRGFVINLLRSANGVHHMIVNDAGNSVEIFKGGPQDSVRACIFEYTAWLTNVSMALSAHDFGQLGIADMPLA